LKSPAALSGWLPRVPPHADTYRPWLVDRGSLTRRLQDRCAAFRVRPVRQALAPSVIDERPLLGARAHEWVMTREVFLYCADTPVIFAHSVVRREGLRGPWRWVGGLGARPLGAALFADPRVARTPLMFRVIGPHHPLFRRATAMLECPPGALWARRSIFLRERVPLLVTEVFLPGILELPR
jgi:chorismate--pyruvate lyase